MKRIVLATIAFCLVATATVAQAPSAVWGEPISAPQGKLRQLYTTSEGGFFAFRQSEDMMATTHWLDHFTDDNRLVGTTDIKSSYGFLNDSQLFEALLPLADRSVLAYLAYKKADKVNRLILKNILPNGEVGDTDFELDRLEAEKASNSGSFLLRTSPDRSKLLVVTYHPYAKEAMAKVNVKVFETKSFNALSSGSYELDFNSRRGNIDDAIVDNAGQVFVLARYTLESKQTAYNLYTRRADGSDWQTTRFESGAKWFDKGQVLRQSPKGDVYFLALMRNKVATATDAIFVACTNAKTLQSTTVINNLGKANNLPLISFNWDLKDLLFFNDGTPLLIGENCGMTRNAVPGGNFEYTYTYNNSDITLFAFAPDNTVKWTSSVPKQQEQTVKSSYDRFDSFVYAIHDNRLVILYNNIALFKTWNSIVVGSKPPYLRKDFAPKTQYPVFCYTVAADGSLDGDKPFGTPLFDFQNRLYYEMSVNTARFLPVDGGLIILDENIGIGRYQFGRVSF